MIHPSPTSRAPTHRRGARIGPFARLRPGAELADDVHIGNFVEVKNSRVVAGAKANHLAYLGDADVGERVNYGAGTITGNYDGANKHRTVIGNDVHIGSDCVLVAPVEVGDGATIGGGTTITKDAPAGQLTVAARARRRCRLEAADGPEPQGYPLDDTRPARPPTGTWRSHPPRPPSRRGTRSARAAQARLARAIQPTGPGRS